MKTITYGLAQRLNELCFEDGYETKPREYFLSDEGIYTMICKPLSVIFVSDCLYLSPVGIENACLRHINKFSHDMREQSIKKLFEIKGLPKIDIMRMYLNSKLSENDFVKANNISYEKWKNVKRKLVFYEYVENSMKEKEERRNLNRDKEGGRAVSMNIYSFRCTIKL